MAQKLKPPAAVALAATEAIVTEATATLVMSSSNSDKCCTWPRTWACCTCCLPHWFCTRACRWFWSCRGRWLGVGWGGTAATPPLLPPASAEKTTVGGRLFVYTDYDSINDHVYDGIPVWVEVPATEVKTLEVSISFNGSVNLTVAGPGSVHDGAMATAAHSTSIPVVTIVEPGELISFALLKPKDKHQLWKLKWCATWQVVSESEEPTDGKGSTPEPWADLKCAAPELRVGELKATVSSFLRVALRPADVCVEWLGRISADSGEEHAM